MEISIGQPAKRGIAELAKQSISIEKVGAALNSGDLDNGLIPFGQDIGRIRDIPTCREIIERTVHEAEKIIDSLAKFNHS